MSSQETTRRIAVIASSVAAGATLVVLGGVLFAPDPKPAAAEPIRTAPAQVVSVPRGTRVAALPPSFAASRALGAPGERRDDDGDDDDDDERERDGDHGRDGDHDGHHERDHGEHERDD